MKKLKVLIFISMFGQFMHVSAQTKEWLPLKTGEKAPDLSFKTLNFSKPSVKISDFKGRLLILDFWSTWCSTCIAEFPKLYELQQHFKDSIQILPVGFETFEAGSIQNFITRREGTFREFKLPTAVIKRGDTTLNALFPHNGLPFEIWIDKTGKFIAATDQFAVNQENIHKFINGRDVYLYDKTKKANFNFQVPLLLNGNGGDENNFEYRSVLTRYEPGVSLPLITDHNSAHTRLAVGNVTIISLVRLALGGISGIDSEYNFTRDFFNKITILESDRNDLKEAYSFNNIFSQSPDSIERYKYLNLYNYDLVLPATFSLREAYKIMFNEIQHLFKLNIVVEKRRIACLALIQANNDSLLNLKKNTLNSVDVSDRDDSHFNAANTTINSFCDYLNLSIKNIPLIINQTAINYPVNMEFFFEKDETVEFLNIKLRRYGLKLIQAWEEAEVLVFY